MRIRLTLLFALTGIVFGAQDKPAEVEKLAPYYPTPETIVQKMLQLGALKAGEKMFDLGSGDGRIVIMAAEKFHANAVGVEWDKELFRQSMDKIQSLRLHCRIGSKFCDPVDLRLPAKPCHLPLGIISVALLRCNNRLLQ